MDNGFVVLTEPPSGPHRAAASLPLPRQQAVIALDWTAAVAVDRGPNPGGASAGTPAAAADGAGPLPGLAGVKHVLGVSSCKGGVGKSTVAVNLAYSLRGLGLEVGLLDADVYGPSLPSMVSPADTRLLRTPEGLIGPVGYAGVKCMSYGWSPQGVAAAMLRGPRVSGLVSQLAQGTAWGELDVLVVDMPPGTGDVQITLGQHVEMTAAVVVSTPHKLARVDVVKGIELMGTLNVPTVAMVENMAHFVCDAGVTYHIFGPPKGPELVERYGIPHLFQFGIDPGNVAAVDSGTPLVLQGDASPAHREQFAALAAAVVDQLERVAADAAARPTISLDPTVGVMIRQGDRVGSVPPALLRTAADVLSPPAPGGELTGAALETITVAGVTPKGNYAAEFAWSDGKRTVIPYSVIWDVCG